ncbi:unnamed protein product [Alopecurus aequalis]
MERTNLNRVMELACFHQIRKELDKFVEDLSSYSITTCSFDDLLPVLRRRMSKLLKSYARITMLYSRTPEGSSAFRIPSSVRDAVMLKPSEVEMDRGKSILEDQVVCPEVEMDRGKSLLEDQVICSEGTHKMEEDFNISGFKLDKENLGLQLKDLNISGFRLDKENLVSSFLLDEDDTDGGGDEEEEMDSDNSPREEQVSSIDSKSELEIGKEVMPGLAYSNGPVKSIVEPVSSRLEVHDNEEMDRGKSDEQLTMEKEEMADEEEDFRCYRSDWESLWGSRCGFFEDMTQVSSMHFTYLTPLRNSLHNGIMGATWQIFSIKIAEIKGGFKWPLSVYGVVAARDAVDHNRNLLFCLNKRRSQIIEQDDPFLRLIGPSRAIVCIDPVDFEIQLKVELGTFSQDKALISGTYHYARRTPGVNMICFENCFCKIELSLEQVVDTVQATLCSVRVLKQGSQLFKYGCRVACSTTSCSCVFNDGKPTYTTHAPSGEVVLFNSHCPATTEGSEGYLVLDRRVVSVQLDGSLEVVIQAYSASGDIAARGHVSFTPKACSVSQDIFYVGDAQVEISVAWSLLVENKRDIAGQGWVFETSHRD